MKSLPAFPKPPKPLSEPIRLTVRGLSHVPSFKNTKSIYRRRDGKPFIATKAERKEWMERAIRLIESQLLCGWQMDGHVMATGQPLRSWIASHAPLDDSWQWIPEIEIKTVKVSPGEEGADIVIERID